MKQFDIEGKKDKTKKFETLYNYGVKANILFVVTL